ncbi:MAG: acyltransferase [Kiritimatiellae bacterium]|nr:acyltransferase [Kiritimatiellia bacterium]
MIAGLLQKWRRTRPFVWGWLFKRLHSSGNVRIGRRLQVDSFPDLMIDPGAELVIGDNVILRKDVELRAHMKSRVAIKSDVRIDRGVRILATNGALIQIDEGARIGLYSVLNGGDDIHIGDHALVSGFVYLQTSMHKHEPNALIQQQGFDHAPVTLGKGVWLGAHVVVLPGCEVGEGAVVGSNAVVTRSIAAGLIAAGIPAQPLKSRDASR